MWLQVIEIWNFSKDGDFECRDHAVCGVLLSTFHRLLRVAHSRSINRSGACYRGLQEISTRVPSRVPHSQSRFAALEPSHNRVIVVGLDPHRSCIHGPILDSHRSHFVTGNHDQRRTYVLVPALDPCRAHIIMAALDSRLVARAVCVRSLPFVQLSR